MDFLACLASAVHFEVILLLNILRSRKLELLLVFATGWEKEKAFSIALGR